tara:strand:+ start:269 stop:475 length:207 start_codon:yes stop_codon:yes gene_type:complete
MAKRVYKAWTEYEDKTLRDWKKKKVKVRHMAEVLGRSEVSVRNRIAALGISNKQKRKNSWLDRLFFWR